jgi:hypothetical protein
MMHQYSLPYLVRILAAVFIVILWNVLFGKGHKFHIGFLERLIVYIVIFGLAMFGLQTGLG